MVRHDDILINSRNPFEIELGYFAIGRKAYLR